MIVTRNVTVVTAGTRVQAITTRTPCAWISIQARGANVGNIFHGDADVSSTRGHAISPGGGGGQPQYPTMGGGPGINAYDLRELYIDAANDNDVAQIIYCTR